MNDLTIEVVATTLRGWCKLPDLQARRVVELYERTIPSEHLQAILSERRRAVNEITPASTLEERAEPRHCHCGRPILPGQAYAVDGPEHIGCR